MLKQALNVCNNVETGIKCLCPSILKIRCIILQKKKKKKRLNNLEESIAEYKNLTWVWGADMKFCRKDHCLASWGFVKWCQTVILRDGIFYPHQTLMFDSFSCIPFDFQCFILKVAFITSDFLIWYARIYDTTTLIYASNSYLVALSGPESFLSAVVLVPTSQIFTVQSALHVM